MKISKLGTCKLLRIILVIEIIVLISTTVAVARDYQDSWVLEGLEIPFAIFIATYAAYSFVNKDEKMAWIIVFAVIARLVILLIPTLKYSWFQGTEYDQMYVFNVYKYTSNVGFMPSISSRPDILYLPLSSVWLAIVSNLTALPQLATFKYFPLMFWLPYPLIIYVIMRKLGSDQRTIKYSVFISSIPIERSISDIVTGSLFGCLSFVLVLACFISVLKSNKRSYLAISLITGIELVLLHSYSSIVLILGLVMAYILCNNNYARNISTHALSKARMMSKSARAHIHRPSTNLEPVFLFTIIFLIVFEAFYVAYIAPNLLGVSGRITSQWIVGILGIGPKGEHFTQLEQLPSLLSLSLPNILRIFFVTYGASLFLTFLTFLGIITVLRKPNLSKHLFLMTIFLSSIWLFYFAQLALTLGKSGIIEYTRIFRYSLALSPVFIGILLSHFKNKKFNALIVCMVVMLGSIQLYGYQPLLPIASTVRPNLPSNEYILYVGMVNSAYQRYMINFAQEQIHAGKIACDSITQNQILGLTDYDFYKSHVIEYYPFSTSTDANITERDFDYFLIHLPGKSGNLGVKPEIGTREFIIEATHNSSILYSNGESYVLGNPFLYTRVYNISSGK
jgi:hypothetical protein